MVALGQIISLQDSNQSKEIQRRVQLGWAAFGRLRNAPKMWERNALSKKCHNMRTNTLLYDKEERKSESRSSLLILDWNEDNL